MGDKKFTRKIEDFVCENCKKITQGNGYTDHCPHCLYSKHVDINPGDRQADCHGLMKPIACQLSNKNYIIYYQCKKCNFKHRVKSMPNDNLDEILKYINKPIIFP